ncbi:MAG TPA: methylmalonyl-CoA mutase family protein, partial [Caulobacteraceae bacterium]|nr:methylmalonyl-CoA mutase family protein [Caulobacteraceae bacterium]
RSLLIRVDPSGRAGVAIGSAESLATLLGDVSLEETTVALDAGFLGVAAAGWLAAAAKASPSARLAFHLDPLSAFAETGASPGPIEAHLIAGAGLATRLAETHPAARFCLASGRAVHEAGGGEAWELAVMAAAAVAWAKALVGAGLSMQAAFSRVTLGLAADGDVLVTLAKFRAARALWARITRACGVEAIASLEARTSSRMLAGGDPWTNLVRLTAAGFGAAAGGADAIIPGAFTDALGRATPFARRLARNTQLILMEEAHIGAAIDPAGGAWAFEALTDDLAGRAWEAFRMIEAAGGLVEALRGGLIAREVEAARGAIAARLASGETRIVGVTHFRHALDRIPDVETTPVEPVPAPSPPLPGPDSHCPALTPIRLEGLAA